MPMIPDWKYNNCRRDHIVMQWNCISHISQSYMDLTFLTNRRLISIENFVHAYSKLRLRLKEGVKSAFPCSSCCGILPPRAAWMFDTSINVIFHIIKYKAHLLRKRSGPKSWDSLQYPSCPKHALSWKENGQTDEQKNSSYIGITSHCNIHLSAFSFSSARRLLRASITI